METTDVVATGMGVIAVTQMPSQPTALTACAWTPTTVATIVRRLVTFCNGKVMVTATTPTTFVVVIGMAVIVAERILPLSFHPVQPACAWIPNLLFTIPIQNALVNATTQIGLVTCIATTKITTVAAIGTAVIAAAPPCRLNTALSATAWILIPP